jgi:Superinfection immunity protein
LDNILHHFPMYFNIILLILVVYIYLLPTFIAWERHKRQLGVIFVINLFFGFTGIGWVGVLIWAVAKERSDGPA